MSAPMQDNQAQNAPQSNKELNFRALERKLEMETAARIQAEQLAEQRLLMHQQQQQVVEEDDTSEPYVDHKKLEKKLAKFGQQTKQQVQQDIQQAVSHAVREERKNMWIKNNPDFFDVLQKHAEKLAQRDPELADSILEMPESFERQKIVYKNIKALGLDKPEVKAPSIQEKIDSNRRSPYYQPSGVGTAPYASVGDFSTTGQKQAYDKMQQLKAKYGM